MAVDIRREAEVNENPNLKVEARLNVGVLRAVDGKGNPPEEERAVGLPLAEEGLQGVHLPHEGEAHQAAWDCPNV